MLRSYGFESLNMSYLKPASHKTVFLQLVKRRIIKSLSRRNNVTKNEGKIVIESSTFIIALITLVLASLAQTSLTLPTMVSVLYKALKSKTISQTFQLDAKKQIHNFIILPFRCLNQLFCKI